MNPVEYNCSHQFYYLDDCESNVQCSYRGDCQNGECVCFPGYEGKYCEGNLRTRLRRASTIL